MTLDTQVVSLIGSLGFPIVMALLLYRKLEEKDKTIGVALDKLSTAIENNTLVLKEVCGKLENQ